jgi:hypothetical protein
MKRTLIAFGLSTALAVGVAQIAHADHGDDYARGNVRIGTNEIDFSARSNFNGTQPRGRVRIEFITTGEVIEGNVVCLAVLTDNATIIAEVTSIRNPAGAQWRSMELNVTDTGKFSNAPDLFSGLVSTAPASTVCAAAPGGLAVTEGEIVVHDSLF